MEYTYEQLKKTLEKEMEPFSDEEVILLNLDSTPEKIDVRKIYLKRILSQMNERDKVIFNFDNDIPKYGIIHFNTDVNLAALHDDILFVSNPSYKAAKEFEKFQETTNQLSGEFIRLAKTLEKIYGLQGCFQLYTALEKLVDEGLRLDPEVKYNLDDFELCVYEDLVDKTNSLYFDGKYFLTIKDGTIVAIKYNDDSVFTYDKYLTELEATEIIERLIEKQKENKTTSKVWCTCTSFLPINISGNRYKCGYCGLEINPNEAKNID